FVRGIFLCQLECNSKQVERVHRHPTGAIRLLQMAASGEGSAAVEDADVVEAKKSALKNVHAFSIFAVHPPGEIQQQLMEDAHQKCPVTTAPLFLVDLVNAPGRPRMHG